VLTAKIMRCNNFLIPGSYPLKILLTVGVGIALAPVARANPLLLALEREFPRVAELFTQTPSGRVFLEQMAGSSLSQAQLRPFLQNLLREQSSAELLLERLRVAQRHAIESEHPITENSNARELENFADHYLHDPHYSHENELFLERLRSSSSQIFRGVYPGESGRNGPSLLRVLNQSPGSSQNLSDRITRLSQLVQGRSRIGESLSRETRIPEVARWDIQGTPPVLTPTHLLPPAFIQAIEREIGPVEIFVLPGIEDILGSRVQKLALEVCARDRLTGYRGILAKVSFFDAAHLPAGLRHEGWILADGLSLQNPLRPDGTRADAWRAGVPPAIFEYAERGFLQILRASSATHTFSFAQNNYALSVLYRRIGGMRPTPVSQPYFEMLDRVYHYATRLLPEGERARGLLDFQRFIGGAGKDPIHAEESELAALAWSSYRLNRVPPTGMTLLRDEQGKVIGMRLTRTSPQQEPPSVPQIDPHGRPLTPLPTLAPRPIIRFINTIDSTPDHPEILEWGRLMERSLGGITSLFRDLH
jgi:hypothetical protein